MYTAVHQPVNRVFGPMMPPLMTLAIFSGLALLLLLARAHMTRVFTLIAIGTLCSFALAMSSLLVNVPINQEVLSWSPSALPADWMELRDRWWLWHNVRTILSALGFGCQILGALIHVQRSRLPVRNRTQALDATWEGHEHAPASRTAPWSGH